MRGSGWTPSIVPKDDDDQNVYIVLDDFGSNGRAYRENHVERTDLEAVIMDMLEGQYKNPIRVIGFNTAEGWPQDVSGDVAQELRHRCDLQQWGRSILPSGIHRPARRSLPLRPAAASDRLGLDNGHGRIRSLVGMGRKARGQHVDDPRAFSRGHHAASA
jgi:hypothetical protein